MAESLNGKTLGFWVKDGKVHLELLGYEPINLKPATVRDISKTLEALADEAEKTIHHEVKIDFDEIYDFLGKAETKPNPEPLTYAQTQAEPFRPFINDQGKKFNGIGIKFGVAAAKMFGPNKEKTEEDLFQQIYGKCHWAE